MSPELEWKYLLSPAFQVRQVIAAHYVEDCATVIEIGSYKCPIVNYLHGPHDKVLCVDPLIPPELDDGSYYRGPRRRLVARDVEYVRSPFEFVDFGECEDGFGLVALGVDVTIESADKFCRLIQRSSVTVLECWVEYQRYIGLVQRIVGRTDKGIDLRLGLDLRGNPVGDLHSSHPPRFNRELLVLR